MRRTWLMMVLVLGGCDSLWGAFTKPHPCQGDACLGANLIRGDFTPSGRPEIDVLFLIDNSSAMLNKQGLFAYAAPTFFRQLELLHADYHAAIATSDVGNWPQGKKFPADRNCASLAGDDGVFQTMTCTKRTLTTEGQTQCLTVCPDGTYALNGGTFLFKSNGSGNVPAHLEAGVDLGPGKAFQCLALLGEAGCDVEGQLEGARRALDGHNAQNQQFLRSRSALALIFLTDEDDCSVQLSQRDMNDPTLMMCPIGMANPDFHCFNTDYRCLARSISCSESLTTLGPKTSCESLQQSYLEPVSTYVNFFKGLHGEDKLLVAGFWSPKLGGPDSQLVVATEPNGDPNNIYGLNRAMFPPDASCSSTTMPVITGRPQLRLSQFASQFKNHYEASLCDPGSYGTELSGIADTLRILSTNCLSAEPRLDNGHPACEVGDVDPQSSDAPSAPFPVCGDACCNAWAAAAAPGAADPTIAAACKDEQATPCYCAIKSTKNLCQGGVIAGIVRKDDGPAGKVTRFYCARP